MSSIVSLIVCHFQPDFYSLFLYDSVKAYSYAARKVLDQGGDLRNGSALFEAAQNSVIQGQ